MGMSGGVAVKMEKVDLVDLLDYDPSCTHNQSNPTSCGALFTLI